MSCTTTKSGALALTSTNGANSSAVKYKANRPKTSKNRFSTLLGRTDLLSPLSNNPNDYVFSVNHAGEALGVMEKVMSGGESSGALLTGVIRPDSGNKTSRTGKVYMKKRDEVLATLQAATRRQASDYIKESLELQQRGEAANDTFVHKPDVPGMGI